jgi:hypothetical protein
MTAEAYIALLFIDAICGPVTFGIHVKNRQTSKKDGAA